MFFDVEVFVAGEWRAWFRAGNAGEAYEVAERLTGEGAVVRVSRVSTGWDVEVVEDVFGVFADGVLVQYLPFFETRAEAEARVASIGERGGWEGMRVTIEAL